ncbi:hypothetical protein HI806_21510 (plasmid) [Ralstonia solanacearum]|uniref:Uncharacterized protein n=1 Tax=Ralstonia solanacearum TaxID=305 RepID=A0A0S4WZF2_RALSL|nr:MULTISPECIES: hypothetical protein [Ralstonia]AXV71536.1 hypothetical protein CJO74_19725 [Ralstonia solanacearum]API77085.1 hypothetical protein AC251_21060 [Ralstonia pseudosolanacearum]AXW36170.1 hypothetical protein CJO88_23160 [Ralstonia solanacearum]MCK4120372.1 hypothetical protein [Ralstonia pseudosolanacearum]MCK4155255.1 hypothetical protein [Ralstonia pseudosolanacearum]
MPQPLSRVTPEAGIVVIGNAGDRVLARHPDLAVLAIEAIASWSNVESFMLGLFVELFGGHNSLATEVFLSLDGQAAKSAAINVAAASVLKDRDAELRVLRAILAIAKTNEKDRNKLAHWTWGDSPNLPDAVLLVDPRTTVHELDRSYVYVYRAQDFIAITQANDRLCGYGLSFRLILRGHMANRDGSLLAELAAEQEIQERLR